MKHIAYIIIFWALSWSHRCVNAQGNTTCLGTSLNWYTSVVGETPCSTYQRLRQICNSAYTVGSLSTFTPGDTCNEQLAGCCCNSISFALSMLCLNCQQGVGSGVNGDNGIDAGKGAYQMYLRRSDGKLCSPNVNKTLPEDIQSAVCNTKLKIEDDLYGLFWDTGDWFYEYTRQTITKSHAQLSNNTFTHCASTTVNDTTSSAPSSSLSTSTSTGSSATSATSTPSTANFAIVAGAIVGSLSFLAVVGLVLWFLWRKRRRSSTEGYISSHAEDLAEFRIEPFEPSNAGRFAPFAAAPMISTSHLNYNGNLPKETSRSDTASGSRSSQKGEKRSTEDSNNGTDFSDPNLFSHPHSERHVDGGAVLLTRSPSGRLPPAYGEQLG